MEAHLRVLGPLEVWVRGRQVALGGPRRRALLARLAIAHGSVVSTDRLIEDLWSGDAPEQARGVIQAHISTLRRELEPDRPVRAPASVLISRPPGYLLRATRDEDDFAQLVSQAAAARTGGEPVAASQSADEALGLWRGTPYEDVGDSAWLMAERQALEELYLTLERFDLPRWSISAICTPLCSSSSTWSRTIRFAKSTGVC